MMNYLSLFSGIGGLDLGLDRAGWACVGQVEIDPFCRRVLAKHWPEVPRHDDVRTCVNWWLGEPRPAVDAVVGGFPCQPVSVAGRQRAQADERWLWPAAWAVIRDLRPCWAVLENVPGLLARGMGDVLGDLAEGGYDAEWDCIPAATVGAPHRRDRVFLVAYPGDGTVAEGPRPARWAPEQRSAEWGEPRRDGEVGNVADTASKRRPSTGGGPETGGRPEASWRVESCRLGSEVADPHGPRRGPWGGMGWPGPAAVRDGRWATEPDVGRVAHGIPARVDRLRALGNAVVPQVAEHIGWLILASTSGMVA